MATARRQRAANSGDFSLGSVSGQRAICRHTRRALGGTSDSCRQPVVVRLAPLANVDQPSRATDPPAPRARLTSREIAPHLRIVCPHPPLFLFSRKPSPTRSLHQPRHSLQIHSLSLRQPRPTTFVATTLHSTTTQYSVLLSRHYQQATLATFTVAASTMRSFQQLLVLLFALVASVVAQDPTSYVATTTLTSTIQVVLTATVSPGASPTPMYSVPSNNTMVYPTGSSAPSSPSISPKPSTFPGAASGLSVNGAFVAAIAAGLGYLAL